MKTLTIIPIILLFIWISFFPQPIQSQYQPVTNIFLGIVFACLLIVKKARIFKVSDWPLWFFIASLSINVFFAREQDIAFQTYVNLALPLFFIYYIVSETISSDEKLRFFAKTVCVSSMLVATVGFLEIVFRFNPLYEYFLENPFYRNTILYARPISTQFHAPILGTYLIACLPFNLLLFKQNKSLWRILSLISITLGSMVAVFTFSRGVLLGLIAIVIFHLLSQKKYRHLLLFVLILFILIIGCSFWSFPFKAYGIHRMTIGRSGIISSYRFERIAMTSRMITEHPQGIGLKHFRIRFYDYYEGGDKISDEFTIADNMYLTILGETGLIGFLAFLIFIFSILGKARRNLRVSPQEPDATERQRLILSGLVALLVIMGGYELFYWASPYVCFCLFIALIEGNYRRSKIPASSNKILENA